MEKEGSGLLRGSHLVAEVVAEGLAEAVGGVAGPCVDLPAVLVAAELVADEGLAAGGSRSTEIQEAE